MANTKLPLIAFLPCRSGSERVKQKNTRPFAGIEGGLTRIKMEQLLNCSEIDCIVVSTDDPKVIQICENLADKFEKAVKIYNRPPSLATSSVSTDELIKYLPEIITEGIVLWTHVTSPFVDSLVYSKAIQAYHEQSRLNHYDSLMSVTKVQKFLWSNHGPINYDRSEEKWPRTQTLSTLYEVNSGIFIAPVETYINHKDRIGKQVYLWELMARQAMDIDWEEDFKLAEVYCNHEQQQ